MSRWIDADHAIERLGAYLMTDAQIEYGGLASEDIDDWKPIAIDILKGAPSIDIVRCSECTERDDDWCMYWGNVINADDFCSYGERREPSIDIVRCNECRHSFINENHPQKPRICGLTKMCGTTKDDWFCADGERREQ